MTKPRQRARSLLALALIAAAVLAARAERPGAAYAPSGTGAGLDTARMRTELAAARSRSFGLAVGAVVPGYLSPRGLPPVQGRLTVTDTGLVFRAAGLPALTLPLVGPVREKAGRRWRPSAVSLAYVDQTGGRSIYVFRVDAGVFETELPGPLLEVAAHPFWLDSLSAPEWRTDRLLVDGTDSVALWQKMRTVTTSAYADSLYGLFGRPGKPAGLIGERGRRAGRLGEYIRTRDSLALDPGRMTAEAQLRHTLAHELGHRWQNRSPQQLDALWRAVPSIRDPKRYGYGDASEHQAEAIAFAVDFLQTTARVGNAARSLSLLDHYELLVPGSRAVARRLVMHPIYRHHPLRLHLMS